MELFPYEPALPTERWCARGKSFQCAENSCRDHPRKMSDHLTVVQVPENRFEDAIHHLKWNFFADEPLNHAVGLCEKGESQFELERHCQLTLKQGYSRMLVDKNGTVSGIEERPTESPSLYLI